MGAAATAYLSMLITRLTDAKTDQEHVKTLVLNDTDIPDRTAYLLGKSSASPCGKLLDGARLLEKSGCSAIAMPCNTAHAFLHDIRQAVDIPIIDMLYETARICRQRKLHTVGILATEGTVALDLYGEALSHANISRIYPNAETQQQISRLIFDKIKAGRLVDRHELDLPCELLAGTGCDGIILGCTELSMAFGNYAVSAPLEVQVIDPLDALARRIITYSGLHLRKSTEAQPHAVRYNTAT